MKNKKLIALLSPLFALFLTGCAIEFPFIPGNPTIGSVDSTSENNESTSESTSEEYKPSKVNPQIVVEVNLLLVLVIHLLLVKALANLVV